MNHVKRRTVVIVLALLALAAAGWGLGSLLIGMPLSGHSVSRSETALPVPSGGTLRDVYESLPASGGADSRIEVLEDNPEAWAARWRLLSEARERLDVSYFILRGDVFGVSFLGHLLHKAHEGIRVRILLDTLGTKLSRQISGNDYLDTLVAAENVTAKMYRPLTFRYIDVFLTLNPVAFLASDHDKILIADGRLALMGGRNIGAEYFADPADDPVSFHDVDVLLEGRASGASLTAVFDAVFRSGEARGVRPEAIDVRNSAAEMLLAYDAMDAWLRGRPVPEETAAAIRKKGFHWLEDLKKWPRLRGTLAKKKPVGSTVAEVRLLDSSPRLLDPGDPVSMSLLRLARRATREIFIQTPYLILPATLIPLFEEAAARGVAITVLTNSPLSSDNPPSQAFFFDQWPELLARVPTLRLFVIGDRHNFHGKVGTIDGQLALIGTYNMDLLSMAVNGEVVAAIWSASLVRQLDAKPRRLIASGPPRVYEYRIARDAQGRPERDRDGKVVVAFGPKNHIPPEQWRSVERYWTLLRLVKKLPGGSRVFMKKS